MKLHAKQGEIEELGAEIWAVSPDEAQRLKDFRESEGLDVTFLRDPEGDVIRAYGILNPDQPPLPHPTTLVIDGDGTVRWAFTEEDYKVRPEAETVVEAVARLEE